MELAQQAMTISPPDDFSYSEKDEFIAIWCNEDVTDHHLKISKWCEEHNIDAEFVGLWMRVDATNQCSLWKIDDSKHRAFFKLKWS